MNTAKTGYGGTNWVEIFRTGDHVDASGQRVPVGQKELAAIAGADLEARPAPLVFGHPRTDGPAFGWVSEVRIKGDKLLARFKDVPDAVRNLVPQHYRRVSLALRSDWSIRHVGLLGATPPAIAGLADVKFEEEEGLRVFAGAEDQPPSEEDAMGLKEDIAAMRAMLEEMKKNSGGDPAASAKITEMEAKLAALEKTVSEELAKAQQDADAAKAEFAESKARSRKETLKDRLEKLCGEEHGKLTPGQVPQLLAFAEALDAPGQDGKPREMEFSEGQGKKPLVEHFFAFLEGTLPGHGLFQEFNGPGKKDGNSVGTQGALDKF